MSWIIISIPSRSSTDRYFRRPLTSFSFLHECVSSRNFSPGLHRFLWIVYTLVQKYSYNFETIWVIAIKLGGNIQNAIMDEMSWSSKKGPMPTFISFFINLTSVHLTPSNLGRQFENTNWTQNKFLVFVLIVRVVSKGRFIYPAEAPTWEITNKQEWRARLRQVSHNLTRA